MKRTAVSIALVIAVIAIGAAALTVLGRSYDAASRLFVDDAVAKVTARWDPDVLESLASEEFRAATPVEQVRAFARQFDDMLGPLKRYKGAKGEANLALQIGGGVVVTARYVADASFEKGDAQLLVDLVRRAGQWRVVNFRVNPANGAAAAPAPQAYKILGIGRVNFSQGPPALMLKYETNLSIDDKAALSREADQIWARFRYDVENSKLDNAIISANEAAKSGGLISTSRGYNFIYQKGPSGAWGRLDNGVWQPVN